MSILKRRIEVLESKKKVRFTPSSTLTDEELEADAFAQCQKLDPSEIDPRIMLYFISCRSLTTDEAWVRDANHRIDVFLGFLRCAIELKLPKKIKHILQLGYGNVKVPDKDITLIKKTLHDVDLGRETPWLLSYLEASGVVSEYHDYRYEQ